MNESGHEMDGRTDSSSCEISKTCHAFFSRKLTNSFRGVGDNSICLGLFCFICSPRACSFSVLSSSSRGCLFNAHFIPQEQQQQWSDNIRGPLLACRLCGHGSLVIKILATMDATCHSLLGPCAPLLGTTFVFDGNAIHWNGCYDHFMYFRHFMPEHHRFRI